MQPKSETRVLAAVEHMSGKAKAEMQLTAGTAKVEMESALDKTKDEIVLSRCRLEGKIMKEISQVKQTQAE